MHKFGQFLRYDNTVPLILGVVFLGVGSAFAASDEVRTAVYSASTAIVSIDNTYIASKDLSQWSPKVTITSVTEDTDTYAVTYTLETVGVKDNVWQDLAESKILTVYKNDLDGKDLGLYVTKQLNQVVDHELAILKETQEYEQKNVTQKVVATQYSGLVGKFLDGTTETLPGYTPVVPENTTVTTPVSQTQVASVSQTVNGVTIPAAPALQILGNSPAEIVIGSTYSDLGVFVPSGETYSLSMTLDDKSVDTVTIDTSVTGTHTVVYTAVFAATGARANATRIIHVSAPAAVVSDPAPQAATDTQQPSTSTPATTDSDTQQTSTATDPTPTPAPVDAGTSPTAQAQTPAGDQQAQATSPQTDASQQSAPQTTQ